MNKLKFAFALLALMVSGQIMAGTFTTKVYNDTDFWIAYNHKKAVGGWGQWHRIAPHTNKNIGGNAWDTIKEIRVQTNGERSNGDGDKTYFDVPVYDGPNSQTVNYDGYYRGSHGGCAIVHIKRDSSGIFTVNAHGGSICND